MIADYPLTRANRIRLARAFGSVPRVDLSIECVLEDQMGQAYVDDPDLPTAFKIQIGPFFYLAGNAEGRGGEVVLESIEPYTLLMASSPGWIDAAKRMYGNRWIGFTRTSFSPEHLSIEHLDHLCHTSPFRDEVRPMDLSFAARFWKMEDPIDLSAFDSPEDFIDRGIGFYVEKEGTVIGVAYASLVNSRGIEVSVFVSEDYRLQGMGTALGSYLLRWCCKNGVKANWDAANPESCKLAEKLGYVQVGEYQAYFLTEG